MEEEKKKKGLFSWKDSMKLGVGFAVGFTVICVIVILIAQCESESNGARTETTINRIQKLVNNEELVISGITVDWFKTFDNDTIGIYEKDDKYGYYNVKTKEIVIAADYEKARQFSQGLAGVVKDGRVGFINLKGETVIGFNYAYNDKKDGSERHVFRYGYCAIANVDGKYGVIDRTGNWVIAPEYMDVTLCKDYAIAKVGNSFNLQMDYAGNVLNNHVVDEIKILWIGRTDKYNDYEYVRETKYCMYKVNGRCGLMDCKGNILTEPIYLHIQAIGEELFSARLLDDSSYVIIDGKGKVVKD